MAVPTLTKSAYSLYNPSYRSFSPPVEANRGRCRNTTTEFSKTKPLLQVATTASDIMLIRKFIPSIKVVKSDAHINHYLVLSIGTIILSTTMYTHNFFHIYNRVYHKTT